MVRVSWVRGRPLSARGSMEAIRSGRTVSAGVWPFVVMDWSPALEDKCLFAQPAPPSMRPLRDRAVHRYKRVRLRLRIICHLLAD